MMKLVVALLAVAASGKLFSSDEGRCLKRECTPMLDEASLEKLFDKVDTNKDGKLTKRELKALRRGHKLSRQSWNDYLLAKASS